MSSTKKVPTDKLPLEVVNDGAKWLFLPAKIFMSSTCNWPEQRSFAVSFTSIFICFLSVWVIFGVVNRIVHSSDLGVIFSCMLMVITVFETLGRRLLIQINRKGLSELLLIIFYDFWPTNIVAKTIELKIKNKTKTIFRGWAMYATLGALCMLQPVVLAFVQNTKPLFTLFPEPVETSPFYEIAYVFESYMSIEQCFSTITLDIFLMSVLRNCAVQFELLGEYFRSKLGAIIRIPDEGQRSEEASKLISQVVRQHNLLLDSCKTLNGFTKNFFLLRFVTTVVLICITTFMIRLKPETLPMAASYFIAIMIEVYLYCYLGNDVIVTSTKLTDVVFTSGWHLLNVPRNKDLQMAISLLILRAQRPVKMAVGDFGFLTLDSYIKMVKFSFSLYTFLGKTLK